MTYNVFSGTLNRTHFTSVVVVWSLAVLVTFENTSHLCVDVVWPTLESEQWTLVRLASFTNIGESVYTVCQSVHMPYMQTLFTEVHR